MKKKIIPMFEEFSNVTLDVNDFSQFSEAEYRDNLIRLGLTKHADLVGQDVYYVKPGYGIHRVLSWNIDTGEYLLEIDGFEPDKKHKFTSNPFRVYRVE